MTWTNVGGRRWKEEVSPSCLLQGVPIPTAYGEKFLLGACCCCCFKTEDNLGFQATSTCQIIFCSGVIHSLWTSQEFLPHHDTFTFQLYAILVKAPEWMTGCHGGMHIFHWTSWGKDKQNRYVKGWTFQSEQRRVKSILLMHSEVSCQYWKANKFVQRLQHPWCLPPRSYNFIISNTLYGNNLAIITSKEADGNIWGLVCMIMMVTLKSQ